MTPHEFLLFFWHERGWVGREKIKKQKQKSTSENGFRLVKILFNLVT